MQEVITEVKHQSTPDKAPVGDAQNRSGHGRTIRVGHTKAEGSGYAPLVPNPTLPLALSTLASLATLAAAFSGINDLTLYQTIIPEAMLPGALSQDIVSLFSAIALPPVSLWAWNESTTRVWSVWLALVDYVLYAYGLYTVGPVINGLYLLYVFIFSASLWSLVFFFAHVDYSALRASSPRRPDFPRKTIFCLLVGLGTLFPVMWLSMLLPAMESRTNPDGIGIFVLDLSFGIPTLWIAAWVLWRRLPLGDVLIPALTLKMGLLGTSVLLGTLLLPRFGQALQFGEVVVYTLLGPCSLVIGAKAWSCLDSPLMVWQDDSCRRKQS